MKMIIVLIMIVMFASCKHNKEQSGYMYFSKSAMIEMCMKSFEYGWEQGYKADSSTSYYIDSAKVRATLDSIIK